MRSTLVITAAALSLIGALMAAAPTAAQQVTGTLGSPRKLPPI
jgi:hypothetical protein